MGMAFPTVDPGELALVSRADIAQTKSELKEQFYELGYEQAKRDALAIFAGMEPAMRLNIDVRNDLLDSISNLKFQSPSQDS